MAGLKGLEPSTFCVTGRRSKPAELTPQCEAYIIMNEYKKQVFFSKIDNLYYFFYNSKHEKNTAFNLYGFIVCDYAWRLWRKI